MGGKRTLSDAQIDEMCTLREDGWTINQIARHFTDAGTPISPSAIDWQCMSFGADAPPQKRGICTQPVEPYGRGGHVVRPFTPEEDALLVALRSQGVRVCDIMRRTGRPPNSIRARLLTLARREARAEDAIAAE
jgi:hypothetical protein